MTKSVRSPILGYNHNIQFHGQVFHVQTEDSGIQHARLFTHLFSGGTILASKKQEYDATAPEDAVRLLMQRLHKAMIKELKEGVHDPRIEAFFKARGETITMGDRPSLVAAPVAAPAEAGRAVAEMPVQPETPPDDRPRPVSGSIDTPVQPMRAAGATVPPTAPATVPAPVPAGAAPPAAAHTPTPQPQRKPVVVVKPPELKRPPVVIASSAEGVVVKRNVIVNVGGGTPPVQGQISRGTAVPRPAVPYVVREGSYALPTVSRGSGPHVAPPASPPAEGAAPPAGSTPSAPSARDIRMPWEGPAGGAVEAALRGAGTRPPSEHTPTGRAIPPDAALRTRTPSAPSERTPAERAFATNLPSDKSLDEVILEYLSDDAE